MELVPNSTVSYETSGHGVVEDNEGTEAERRSASSACSASNAMSSPGVILTTTAPSSSTDDQTGTGQQASSTRSQHAHILFYRQRFDLDRPIHAFRLLSRMITHAPRRFVETLLSTGPPICESSGELSYLLSCHQKSISGFEFSDGDDVEKNVGCRSPSSICMYFESLFTLSLYYVRSYFVDDPAQKVSCVFLHPAWFLLGVRSYF